jgi:hypothetical protein
LGRTYKDFNTENGEPISNLTTQNNNGESKFTGKRALSRSDGALNNTEQDVNTLNGKAFQDFLLDFTSIIAFSYRKDFPPLEPSKITTDIGWGCMVRTGILLRRNIMTHDGILSSDDGCSSLSKKFTWKRYYSIYFQLLIPIL